MGIMVDNRYYLDKNMGNLEVVERFKEVVYLYGIFLDFEK